MSLRAFAEGVAISVGQVALLEEIAASINSFLPRDDSYPDITKWNRYKSFQADQLDLSGISGLEVLNPVTRNVGDRAIAAYWDDLQLAVEQGPASGYDVQVARGAT